MSLAGLLLISNSAFFYKNEWSIKTCREAELLIVTLTRLNKKNECVGLNFLTYLHIFDNITNFFDIAIVTDTWRDFHIEVLIASLFVNMNYDKSTIIPNSNMGLEAGSVILRRKCWLTSDVPLILNYSLQAFIFSYVMSWQVTTIPNWVVISALDWQWYLTEQ